jgi:nitrite reductase/ring-hydroxylating ferredoxin subunit
MNEIVIQGQWYMVPTVRVHDGGFDWPILDNPHTDEGSDVAHYNLDTRFLNHARFKQHIENNQQTVIAASAVEKSLVYLDKKKCYRTLPHRNSYYENKLYLMVKAGCEGKKMTNMTCPHRGQDLSSCPVIDDIVTCPAHGMQWHVKTGDMAERPRLTTLAVQALRRDLQRLRQHK